jgi:hypothetical protein
MNQKKKIGIAQQLLDGIGERKDPDTIAAMFTKDVVFEISSDGGVLPGSDERRIVPRFVDE